MKADSAKASRVGGAMKNTHIPKHQYVVVVCVFLAGIPAVLSRHLVASICPLLAGHLKNMALMLRNSIASARVGQHATTQHFLSLNHAWRERYVSCGRSSRRPAFCENSKHGRSTDVTYSGLHRADTVGVAKRPSNHGDGAVKYHWYLFCHSPGLH